MQLRCVQRIARALTPQKSPPTTGASLRVAGIAVTRRVHASCVHVKYIL